MGCLAWFDVFPAILRRDQPHQSIRPPRRLAKRTLLRGGLRLIRCPAVPRTPSGVPPQRERSIHSGKGLFHSIGEVCYSASAFPLFQSS